ncbi:MAG: Yip1 family protein [Rhodanobacter sp.]
MDFGKIVERVKAILTTPKTEWPVVAAEPDTVRGLYAGYIAIVAALPVIAHFIKNSLIGTGAFGITVRLPIGMGIVAMVLQYVLALVMVYLLALIISALAPTFGGQKDQVQALKTVAYSWTAGWVAGIAVILPWLGWLIAIAGGIYGIYLLYLGLPETMRCPPDKAGGYTAVSVIIAIVIGWILYLIIASVIGTAAITGAAMGGMHVTGSHDESVVVDGNSALAKLTAMSAASKQLSAAQQSTSATAQQLAMGKVAGAVAGGGSVEPLSLDQVKGFLPDSLGDLKRTGMSAQRSGAMGMQVADATAQYSDSNGHNITLEVTDTGSAKGLVAMASAMAPEEEKQTDHGYEKTHTESGRLIHEAWDTQSKSGEFSVIVGQRFTVKATGTADGIDQLKQAVTSVDLAKLESMKDQGVTKN